MDGLGSKTSEETKGLRSFSQEKSPNSPTGLSVRAMIQVVHCRGDHGIVASSIRCDRGIVKVEDSAYSN